MSASTRGELIHLDIKKLGRIGSVGHRITGRFPGAINRHHGIGWEFVHVCIDDASRVFVQVMPDQRKESAIAFLEATVAYFARLGVRVERVMTDNGSCYRSKKFRAACQRLGLRQLFIKPYTPKTNGKAERFIQTSLREWAYARAYQNSDQRTAELQRNNGHSRTRCWLGLIERGFSRGHEITAVVRSALVEEPRDHLRVNDRRVLNGIFWVLRSGALS